MTRRNVAIWISGAAAILSMVAALIPLFKGESMNVTFLGAGVVFFIIAVVTARKAREGEHKTPT